MKSSLILCVVALLCSCATSRPDHFYILSPRPAGSAQPASMPTVPVQLKITLPSLVDRPEMVLNSSQDAVTVLEHQRWGAPLPDLVAQTLGQDIERRRNDLLIGFHGGARSGPSAVNISVDVIRMTTRPGDHLSIETHWRIMDARKSADVEGSGVFSAPLGQEAYSGVAEALSDCLGQLADRLVSQIQ